MKMFYVGLENYRETFFIGLYEEERHIPNTVEFNIKIGKKTDSIQNLPDWDYSQLSQLIHSCIGVQSHHIFLEDLMKAIVTQIKNKWAYDSLFLSIKKLNPPTNEYIQASYVEWIENN